MEQAQELNDPADRLREDLLAIMEGIEAARSQTYSGNRLAKLIRDDWSAELRKSARSDRYSVKASAGSGNWAEVVWASIFDRLVTESATKGYYVCYLVSPRGDQVVLALALATTEIRDRYGDSRYEEILRTNAASDLGLLTDQDLSGLKTGPVNNGGNGPLARGYEAGTIAALVYRSDELPDVAELRADLTRLLHLYRALFDAKAELEQDRGTSPVQSTDSSAEQKHKKRRERRRTRVHESAERNQTLSRAAKKLRGTTCEVPACRKNLSMIYGPLAEGLIEAHHIIPFSQLDDNVELDPEKDFRVVCPDCHRAIHSRRPEPFTLEEISRAMLDPDLPDRG